MVLPLLESDLLTVMQATTNGTLDKTEVKFSDGAAACVILAEDAQIDEVTLQKAAQQGITLFSTSMPIFEAALSIYQKLNP
mgnify:CR=1 FL=1